MSQVAEEITGWDDNPDEYADLTDPVSQQEDPYTGAYADVLNSPSYADMVKRDQSPKSREYERKVKSVVKTIALGSLSSGNAIDGATLLHHGKGLARAAGDLAAVSDRTARALDVLSAPDNPYFVFTMAAVTLGLQLLRNHEEQAAEVSRGFWAERKARKARKREGLPRQPKVFHGPSFTIRGPFGRKVVIRVPLPRPAFIGGAFRAQTQDPMTLAHKVLSDPKLIRELEKQGIRVQVTHAPE